MDLEKNHLSVIDYTVFGLMLVISALIGIYYKLSGGRQQTTEEYLLANKQMSVIPVAFSLMASFMSAITLLGVTAEIYMFGIEFIIINISYIIGTPIAGLIFLPVFYKLKVVSIYEYLEKRFNRTVRITASLVFTTQMIVYMSIVLYAPALALSAVTGLSKWTAIISVGFVCTLYCTIGGIKAVIWTDVFQSILMFTALIAIIIKGTVDVGGIDVVWHRALVSNRLNLINLDPNPFTRQSLWSLTIGGVFIYVSLYGVNQTQVQRLLTLKSLRKSQKALTISWILTSMLSLITAFTGLVIFANFWKCDPLLENEILKSDQLMPYFVMKSLATYPGLPGLIIAGIFSGSLSSVSSFVNSLAAVSLEDYIKPHFRDRLSQKFEIIASKILVMFYGCLCVSLTVLADQMPAILQASLIIFGVVGGPLLMLFTAGMCCPGCNSFGTLIGFVISLIVGFWIGIGNVLFASKPIPLSRSTQECPNNMFNNLTSSLPQQPLNQNNSFSLYNLSYMWFSAFTFTIGLIIAIILSKLKGNQKPVNNSLLTPLLRSSGNHGIEINDTNESIKLNNF
ncbi:putative sodium-dependent multivitamin transporter [Oppia nitens]|uniref:putative sodium-dependent multivitamin transporter n=1 Tax=Oppia nitens TaxID=1686743 RepID=UPI0023DBFD8A|nr:putative sodium-dependent multivitamin transporter [Oppia nitens]